MAGYVVWLGRLPKVYIQNAIHSPRSLLIINNDTHFNLISLHLSVMFLTVILMFVGYALI